MTKTKKIAAGEYETTINGREYQISHNDLMGRWNAVAVEGLTTTWINDTATKKDAIALCEEHANKEHNSTEGNDHHIPTEGKNDPSSCYSGYVVSTDENQKIYIQPQLKQTNRTGEKFTFSPSEARSMIAALQAQLEQI